MKKTPDAPPVRKLQARRVGFELDGRVFTLDLFGIKDLAETDPTQGVQAVHAEVVDMCNMFSLGFLALARDFKNQTGKIPEEFMKYAKATQLTISDAKGNAYLLVDEVEKLQKIWTPKAPSL